MPETIESWLAEAHRRLKNISDSGSVDFQAILASVLKHDRSWILAHPEYKLKSTESKITEEALRKLERRIPLPYILGLCHFYGMEFRITPDVLIPRPETELLVEKALILYQLNNFTSPILDVGTGSGCIAVALAAHLPNAQIFAFDRSIAAIHVAKSNSSFHKLENRINFINSDLVSSISGKFQLVCANLPYIPTSKLDSLTVTEFEPALALDGGVDGLCVIDRLLQDVNRIATDKMCLLLEIEAGHGITARNLAEKNFPGANIQVFQDYSSKDRLLTIERM